MQRGLDRLTGPALDSIGVDTWGCDYALLGERGDLLENPYHYRDARTDGVMAGGLRSRRRATRSTTHRHPVPAVQHALPALRRVPRDAAADRRRRTRSATIPDLLNYWLTGRAARRVHQRDDDAVRRRADAELGDRTCSTRLDLPDAAAAAARRAGHGARAASRPTRAPRAAGTPVVAPACHDTGSAVASVDAGGTSAFLSSGTWSLLGTERAAPDHHGARARAELHQRRRRLRDDAAAEEHRRPVAAAVVPADRGRAGGHDLRLRRAADGGGAARAPAFTSLFDPDHRGFLHPADMVAAIARLLPPDRAARAGRPGGVRARDPREPGVQVPRRARVARGADRHAASTRSGSSAADRATGC